VSQGQKEKNQVINRKLTFRLYDEPMITKVRYICALVAGLFLFALFAPLPAQAASEPLKWASVEKPGLEGNIVVTPSEVSEIAVGDDGVIYRQGILQALSLFECRGKLGRYDLLSS